MKWSISLCGYDIYIYIYILVHTENIKKIYKSIILTPKTNGYFFIKVIFKKSLTANHTIAHNNSLITEL
jgi:hypothetical protein